MNELEELRKLLAETSDPKKQTTIMTKIRRVEKELGIKPQPQVVSEDWLAAWSEDEEDDIVPFNKNGKVVIKPI